ncbi:cell surface immobilization antigen (macronuclear) [Tetrahymena thermophila SB210]|uniref:Cell surface immobilization antigen n=1 Tax=Tetrahymena thermophila (strain SB210) TaxID=312017 RepID=Q23JC9_TETTS|nr:cell surface immobilization antigen [Tetrahymena thermophila SB210]EAR96575.1 cell surface immobilization antigen [Tetrahymena thermophila SB210]|eukprot:XP_001016820.1 cell surface immobilization antigen [Tetrahymena thermophila SB210]
MIKQLLVISLSVALVLAGTPGQDVVCNGNTNDVTSCGPAGGSSWTAGTTSGSKIADCTALSASLSGIFDTLCASCQTTNVYAKSTQDGCINTPTAGANVACYQSGSCSCGNPPTPAFKWKSVDTTNCQIASCLAAPMPTSSLTDQFCASCGKTNTYANSYGTACVNPSASCTRKTGWTDSDCKVCNASGTNSSNIYASADRTSCTATAPSSSSSSSAIAFSSLIIASLLL